METSDFVLISLLFLLFGIFSRKIQQSNITAPMVFVAVGLFLGPIGLGIIRINVTNRAITVVAELILALVLFSDASRIDLKSLRKSHNLPIRLLSIGLPLTILFGSVIAYLLFGQLLFWEAAILATVLAPTDAALGEVVVSNPRVPSRIRQTLNIESGLNDGLVVPIITTLLSLACALEVCETEQYWFLLLIEQIGIGIVIGLTVGFIGSKICTISNNYKWMNQTFKEISTTALALFAFSLSEILWGNGFIAAFIAGLIIGNYAQWICKSIHEFASVEGQLLALLLFFFFGAVFAGPAIKNFDGWIILYAILSLTIIRIIPVLISLIGCRLRWESLLYLSWFGPRGIASIVFALIVLEDHRIGNGEKIFLIATITILISIFAHGFTARPLSNWYSKKTKRKDRKSEEHKDVSEYPVRLPYID